RELPLGFDGLLPLADGLFHLLGGGVELGFEFFAAAGISAEALLDDAGDFVLQAGDLELLRLFVDLSDHVLGEVEDAFEVPWGNVEQEAELARGALYEPDVAHGARELDVAHALTAHLLAGNLDTALVADDALIADALVLAAVALEVLGGAEDLLAEEAVLF